MGRGGPAAASFAGWLPFPLPFCCLLSRCLLLLLLFLLAEVCWVEALVARSLQLQRGLFFRLGVLELLPDLKVGGVRVVVGRPAGRRRWTRRRRSGEESDGAGLRKGSGAVSGWATTPSSSEQTSNEARPRPPVQLKEAAAGTAHKQRYTGLSSAWQRLRRLSWRKRAFLSDGRKPWVSYYALTVRRPLNTPCRERLTCSCPTPHQTSPRLLRCRRRRRRLRKPPSQPFARVPGAAEDTAVTRQRQSGHSIRREAGKLRETVRIGLDWIGLDWKVHTIHRGTSGFQGIASHRDVARCTFRRNYRHHRQKDNKRRPTDLAAVVE